VILLNPRSKVYVYTEAIDFRNGIEGLVRICENRLGQDPYSGVFFLFVSRNRISIKVLVYDGQGFWCMQKRLSSGKFRRWPESQAEYSGVAAQVLLSNGDVTSVHFQEDWRRE
jgi:transposase